MIHLWHELMGEHRAKKLISFTAIINFQWNFNYWNGQLSVASADYVVKRYAAWFMSRRENAINREWSFLMFHLRLAWRSKARSDFQLTRIQLKALRKFFYWTWINFVGLAFRWRCKECCKCVNNPLSLGICLRCHHNRGTRTGRRTGSLC